jgi:hypothetical protein
MKKEEEIFECHDGVIKVVSEFNSHSESSLYRGVNAVESPAR